MTRVRMKFSTETSGCTRSGHHHDFPKPPTRGFERISGVLQLARVNARKSVKDARSVQWSPVNVNVEDLTPSKETRLVSSRVCFHIVRLALVLMSLPVDAGLKFGAAQTTLNATYTATLLSLPIGEMSWTVELQDNRFKSGAKGNISGFLRLFLDAQGEVTAHDALAGGKPVASNFALKLFAGKWSDEARIVFRATRRRNMSPPRRQVRAPTSCRSQTPTV
jgi:hypothetical protein